MPFNSITADLPIGYAGQIAEPAFPKFARSVTVETAISAGAVAKRGTDPETQIKPLEAGDTVTPGMIAGVVILSPTRPYEQVDGGSGIEAGNTAAVLRLGSIFMQFAEAVTAGELVGQALSTGLLYGYPAGTAPGDLAAGRVLIPGLRIAQTTSASGPACVEVNLLDAHESSGPLDPLRMATATAFAANDSIIAANPPSGTTYDIPTTGAASTVTLPATAAEGTILYFTADGTKNGHTVQYRDASGPVNLTTALTASKRHLVVAIRQGSLWFCNAYVSP